MSIKNEILQFDNINGEKLGIKVFLAKDTESQINFIIIADVNPAGYCYSRSISPGDIILAINGTEVSTYDTYMDIIKDNDPISEITIMKSGILDESDLFKRCFNTPCTDVCKTWNETSSKLCVQDTIINKQCNSSSDPVYILKPAKTSKSDDPSVKDTPVRSDSSAKQYISNNPKIKFHHKISPTSKNKNISGLNETSNIKYKPTKSLTKDIIPLRIPHFVKREDFRSHDINVSNHLKEAKSLDNLTDFADDSQIPESISPTSVSPISSFKLSSGLSTEDIFSKPKVFSRRRSFDLVDSSSQKPVIKNETILNNINDIKDEKSLLNKVILNSNEFKEVHKQICQKRYN